jgi:hypothetical protein
MKVFLADRLRNELAPSGRKHTARKGWFNELRALITKSYTPETWAKMPREQKSAFQVPGSEMGLIALATRFGVKGDPVGSHAIHLELGDNIFGATQIQEHRKAQHRD